MKSYIKGIITGVLIGAVVFAVPAMAVNLDAVLNAVRINVNGVDEIQWDEDITLSNGETSPASILYNGTTYLPMRKLGELSGQKIYWNGDSKTVSMTGAQEDIKVVAKKPDKDGNVWEYYTFKDSKGKNYLGAKDEARGYERVYRIASSSVRVTDEEMYFARPEVNDNYAAPPSAELFKINFKNDKNSQDGEKFGRLFGAVKLVFDGDYIFYNTYRDGDINPRTKIYAYNYVTGEKQRIFEDYDRCVRGWELGEHSGESAVIKCIFKNEANEWEMEITFDKTTNTFSEPTRVKENE